MKQKNWEPVAGHTQTLWAKEVNPAVVLPDYPRPQLVRKEWLNLNGLWDYAIQPKDQPGLWYRRTIKTPAISIFII